MSRGLPTLEASVFLDKLQLMTKTGRKFVFWGMERSFRLKKGRLGGVGQAEFVDSVKIEQGLPLQNLGIWRSCPESGDPGYHCGWP
jgi:hypothetical protein